MNSTFKNNILYIVHNYNNFQKDPIERIAKYFNRVYVLVRYKPYSMLANHFPLEFLKRYSDQYCLDLSNLPSNVEVIKSNVWYVPWGNSFRNLGDKHFKSVIQIIKDYQIHFDLIHAHFLYSSGYVGVRLKDIFDVPLVVTGHGYDVYELPHRDKNWRNIIKTVLEKADEITTVSQSNKEMLVALGRNHVSIIRNGYDPKRFFPRNMSSARSMLGIPPNQKVIVSIGNLVKVKGHQYLIDAINLIVKQSSNVVCYIVGGGALMPMLKTQIMKFGLSKHVFLVGAKPHSEIPLWLNSADCFVLPSLNESMGTVLVEALACGIPVVASDVGGVKEIICDENIGYLCQPMDAENLSESIRSALQKKWDREQIVEYSQPYSLDSIVTTTISMYQKLLTW